MFLKNLENILNFNSQSQNFIWSNADFSKYHRNGYLPVVEIRQNSLKKALLYLSFNCAFHTLPPALFS